MKVLVTGAKGQLGRDVTDVFQSLAEVFPFGRDELDVTDMNAVRRTLESVRPDVVIHAAAYTQVDQAEQDVDGAFRVNALGTRNVAVAAEAVGSKLVYISTDYVFDGTKPSYCEWDPPRPINVYGRSKLAGEEMVARFHRRHFIVRTSWLYGRHGKNFVTTMLELGRKTGEVSVVTDQVGSPTYTLDLAVFLRSLVQTDFYGTYHASNTGACSWHEFAKAIFAEAGMADVKVHPILTGDLGRPAPRPASSVLDHLAIRLHGFPPLRPWRDGLRAYFHG